MLRIIAVGTRFVNYQNQTAHATPEKIFNGKQGLLVHHENNNQLNKWVISEKNTPNNVYHSYSSIISRYSYVLKTPCLRDKCREQALARASLFQQNRRVNSTVLSTCIARVLKIKTRSQTKSLSNHNSTINLANFCRF